MNIVLAVELHALRSEVTIEAYHVFDRVNLDLAFLKLDRCLTLVE